MFIKQKPIDLKTPERYFLQRRYQILITISINRDIHSFPLGEYYISDWRDKSENWLPRPTVPGYFGKELLKYLEKNNYEEMTNDSELAYYLLMKAGTNA